MPETPRVQCLLALRAPLVNVDDTRLVEALNGCELVREHRIHSGFRCSGRHAANELAANALATRAKRQYRRRTVNGSAPSRAPVTRRVEAHGGQRGSQAKAFYKLYKGRFLQGSLSTNEGVPKG